MATPRKKHPKKAGRKTQYKAEYNDLAYKYCLLNAKDTQLAAFFGVAEKTLNYWKKQYPAFRTSIRDGKELADMEVAERLHARAVGFEYDEDIPTKVKEVTYENGKRLKEVEHIEITTVHRIIPPEPRAIQYWLNNRRRKRAEKDDDNNWADRQEVDHSNKGEKFPTPMVYLPQDISRDAVEAEAS